MIYEYQCNICKSKKEWFSSIKEKPEILLCSNCGIHSMYNIINFKGFHRVDEGRHFSIALGKEFKNGREKKAYAKDMGYIHVDNAKPEEMHKWRNQNKKEQIKSSENFFKEQLKRI